MTIVSLPDIVSETDIEHVRRYIESAGPSSILNLFSSRGVPKAALLRRIWDEYHSKRPTALVSMKRFMASDEEGGFRLDLFLKQIVQQLQTLTIGSVVSSLKAAESIVRASDLAQEVLELVSFANAKGTLPLIIIEDYERLPVGSRVVFEDEVLSRVVESPRQAIVILSSERELRFTDRLDLRIRLETYELSRPTADDIARSVPQYSVLAPEILKWTSGIPELVEFLVEEATKTNINSLDEFRAHEEDLLGPAYRELVRHVLFPDVELASDEVLDMLALLRRFDVGVLSYILPKIDPRTFTYYKQKHYLDLIHELGSRIYWREQGGYALDNVLKTMLSSYVHKFEHDTYEMVNRLAEVMYREWLHKVRRQYYLLEMLYHQMILDKSYGLADEAIASRLSDTLLDDIKRRNEAGPRDIDDLGSLRHALEQDTELRPFVRQEVFDAIDRRLRAQLQI